MRVAVVHDYLTQTGGAERVTLDLLDAFPGSELWTAAWNRTATYPQFLEHEVHTTPLDRVPAVRRDHRLGLPFYAPVFSAMRIDADVVVCSSSGWSHAVRTKGKKLVYCHNPARWLYQPEQYLREAPKVVRGGMALLAPALRRWDARAASSVDRYVANSTVVAERIQTTYGVIAEVVPPPAAVLPEGEQEPVPSLAGGFLLVVARLQPYKNVDVVVRAVRQLPGERLVVVGKGPDLARLQGLAGPETVFLQDVPDAQMRWLYASSRLLVAASHEDFGLTPLEAGAFGKPVVALRWGGFLDTVQEGVTGEFFDEPSVGPLLAALRRALGKDYDLTRIAAHQERFSRARFMRRMRELVAELHGEPGGTGTTAS